MNIAEILVEQARRRGGQTSIEERGRSITFEQLERAASAAAEDFRAAGIGPGMRALVLVPMAVDLYVAVIGLFHAGAAAVFVDPSVGRERRDGMIRRVHPDAFVGVPRAHALRLTSAAIRAIPTKMVTGGYVPGVRRLGRHAPSGSAPPEALAAGTTAIVTFTSGSTGEPKAAVRTHGFLMAQHRALVESLCLTSDDIVLSTLPVFVFSNLASGATTVIADADLRSPAAVDPARLLHQAAATRPTVAVASPALLERVATHAARTGARLDSFGRIFTGGAPVFPRTLDAIARAAPSAIVTAVYGSTEAEPIAKIERLEIAPEDREAMRGGAGLLVGTPAHAIRVRVVRDRWGTPLGPWSWIDLERESLGSKAAGEIIVSGEHVLSSYLDGVGDEETKIRVEADVWHRTGDAGYFDSRGRLWLLGRSAARVRDGEGELYPFAVECAVSDIPGVKRSAFLLHGDRRTLVIEWEEAAAASDPAEVLAHVSWARIARVVVSRIPVDNRHNAKVDYPALRRMLDRTA